MGSKNPGNNGTGSCTGFPSLGHKVFVLHEHTSTNHVGIIAGAGHDGPGEFLPSQDNLIAELLLTAFHSLPTCSCSVRLFESVLKMKLFPGGILVCFSPNSSSFLSAAFIVKKQVLFIVHILSNLNHSFFFFLEVLLFTSSCQVVSFYCSRSLTWFLFSPSSRCVVFYFSPQKFFLNSFLNLYLTERIQFH